MKVSLTSTSLSMLCGAFALTAMTGVASAGPLSVASPDALGISAPVTTNVTHHGKRHHKKKHHEEKKSY